MREGLSREERGRTKQSSLLSLVKKSLQSGDDSAFRSLGSVAAKLHQNAKPLTKQNNLMSAGNILKIHRSMRVV